MDFLINSKKTLIEMISDRGFIIDNINYKNTNPSNYNFDCIKENLHLYVIYISISCKTIDLKNHIEKINNNENNNGNEIEIIFIFQEKPNSNMLKFLENYNYCSYFCINNLQVNITKHKLVPKHELISSEETDSLMKKHNLISKNQLPFISKNDPIVKYYNFKPGNVCKITRKNDVSSEVIFYRLIK